MEKRGLVETKHAGNDNWDAEFQAPPSYHTDMCPGSPHLMSRAGTLPFHGGTESRRGLPICTEQKLGAGDLGSDHS